jgi:hypothetical protein
MNSLSVGLSWLVSSCGDGNALAQSRSRCRVSQLLLELGDVDLTRFCAAFDLAVNALVPAVERFIDQFGYAFTNASHGVLTLERAFDLLRFDQAAWNVGEPALKLSARALQSQNDCPALIEADKMEAILAEVDADRADGG